MRGKPQARRSSAPGDGPKARAGNGPHARRAVLLAFDTSAAVGSVAVGRGREVLARALLLRRGEHASRLVPTIGSVLDEAGLGRADLDGIVVGRGPGSFTGVRIGAATARGLAMGLGIPVWAWSSLAAAAASYRVELPPIPGLEPPDATPELPAEAEGWPRYVLLDARDRRVYGACYRVLPDRIETLVPPHAGTVDDVLEADLPGNVLFCGDGALRHAVLLEDAGHLLLAPPVGLPTADGLLRVHALLPDAPPLPPESRWVPDYLRAFSVGRPGAGGRKEAG